MGELESHILMFLSICELRPERAGSSSTPVGFIEPDTL